VTISTRNLVALAYSAVEKYVQILSIKDIQLNMHKTMMFYEYTYGCKQQYSTQFSGIDDHCDMAMALTKCAFDADPEVGTMC
jgi:hypothetical protein